MERDRATIAVRSPMSRDSGGQSHESMDIRGGQRLKRKKPSRTNNEKPHQQVDSSLNGSLECESPI